MSFFRSFGTEIKDDVVGESYCSSESTCRRKPNGALFELIAIAQEFNTPFFEGQIKIYPAAFCSVFGKGHKRTLGVSVAAAVKFVPVLCFRRTLNKTRADLASSSQRLWRKHADDSHRKIKEFGGIERSGWRSSP